MELEKSAKFMDKTAEHPWTTFLGNPMKGGREKRVNDLARKIFDRDFRKKYAGREIYFEGENGRLLKLKVVGPSFNSLYANYNLTLTAGRITEDGHMDPVSIDPTNPFAYFPIMNDGCIERSKKKDLVEYLGPGYRISNESLELIDEMLSYQSFYRNHNSKKYLRERIENVPEEVL